jgi:D-psicose/D-tagatose/L-ribulose 3-epimerase
MKFGANTFIWAAQFDESLHSLLPRLRQQGFDGIEVPLINPKNFDAAGTRKAVEANGLECTVCSILPGNLSLATADAGVRRQAIEHLKHVIALTAEVGAKLVAGPLYSPVGFMTGVRRTPEEWKRVVGGYQELDETLKSTGVTVAVEPLNRFETYFLNTCADAAALCKEIGHPQVGVLFDTFHANIEEKQLGPAILSLRGHLKHVHTCENDRGTPGTGHVDWNATFEALRALNYDGWVTIESFGFSLGELSAAASIWRDIAPSAEAIAFDGVRFLRSHLASAAASS